MADNGIEENESLIKYCEHGGMILSEVEEVVKELINMKPKPDAIFASADKLTTGCLRILKAKGLKVPDDMGLIGFSNTDTTELIDPPLSIIKQPAFEMGEIATDLLIQLIESKRPVTDFETKKLAPQLIIRESAKNKKNKVSVELMIA